MKMQTKCRAEYLSDAGTGRGRPAGFGFGSAELHRPRETSVSGQSTVLHNLTRSRRSRAERGREIRGKWRDEADEEGGNESPLVARDVNSG